MKLVWNACHILLLLFECIVYNKVHYIRPATPCSTVRHTHILLYRINSSCFCKKATHVKAGWGDSKNATSCLFHIFPTVLVTALSLQTLNFTTLSECLSLYLVEKPLFDVANFGNANVQHANVLSLMDFGYTSILANTFSVTSSSVLSTLFLQVLKHVYYFYWTFK